MTSPSETFYSVEMEHLDHFHHLDQNDPIQENYRPILLFQPAFRDQIFYLSSDDR